MLVLLLSPISHSFSWTASSPLLCSPVLSSLFPSSSPSLLLSSPSSSLLPSLLQPSLPSPLLFSNFPWLIQREQVGGGFSLQFPWALQAFKFPWTSNFSSDTFYHLCLDSVKDYFNYLDNDGDKWTGVFYFLYPTWKQKLFIVSFWSSIFEFGLAYKYLMELLDNNEIRKRGKKREEGKKEEVDREGKTSQRKARKRKRTNKDNQKANWERKQIFLWLHKFIFNSCVYTLILLCYLPLWYLFHLLGRISMTS